MGFRIIPKKRKICENRPGMKGQKEGQWLQLEHIKKKLQEKCAKIKQTTLFYNALGSIMTYARV